MAETFIHIYADVKGDWRPSSMRDATDHADGPGHSTMNAESIRHLVDVFTHLKKRGTKVDRLDFHTHGAPGHLAIGADFLGFQELSDNFKNRGFEKIFKKNARVFFHGCNVADRADGEMFLAVFGAIFLREGGGRVGASTSYGFAAPFWPISGKVLHFTGRTVYAYVSPGGHVELKNHRFLNPKVLRARVSTIEKELTAIERRDFPYNLRPQVSEGRIAEIRRMVKESKGMLARGKAAFIVRLQTCLNLDDAEKKLQWIKAGNLGPSHRRLYQMSRQSMSSFK